MVITQSQVMLKVCPGASTKIGHFTESEYAHFTFRKIIWPLSLLSNLRTDIMTSAETVLRLYCRDCVLRLYLGQRLSVHVMYLICTYVLPQPCLCFARLPYLFNFSLFVEISPQAKKQQPGHILPMAMSLFLVFIYKQLRPESFQKPSNKSDRLLIF